MWAGWSRSKQRACSGVTVDATGGTGRYYERPETTDDELDSGGVGFNSRKKGEAMRQNRAALFEIAAMLLVGLVSLLAAAPAGAAIEMRLEIPAATRTVVRSFMRVPPYENAVIGFRRIRQTPDRDQREKLERAKIPSCF